jgi:hypothetical protein
MKTKKSQPRVSYVLTDPEDTHIVLPGPQCRVIEVNGRRGVNFTSIRGRIALPEHTLNEPRGTVSMWVMALDDLAPSAQHPHHAKSNEHFAKNVLLTDREVVPDTDAASFCLVWECYWHPVFYAKFAQGSHLQNSWAVRGAEALAGHFEFHRLEWYLITVRWDYAANLYEIFANGVQVAGADTTTPDLPHQPCGPVLYLGSPALAVSEVHFFDELLTPEQINELPGSAATSEPICTELKRMFEGRDLPSLDWKPDRTWIPKLKLSLKDKAHYHQFFLQGCGSAVSFTDEGFRIRTPDMKDFTAPKHTVRPGVDMTRMYLWTRDVFEGDLAVSFEFKLNTLGGLGLLMTQAAGMQGEDFLHDYPLRVNGSMATVCWEDVRNYHWEFYRDTVDVPNYHVCHACLKNPWFKPMSFQCEDRRWETDRWYRLDYVQEGARLRGAIDNVTVMDTMDDAFGNNGPVLLNGRIALRCMMRTDMIVRNLGVWSRPHFKTASECEVE